MYLVCRVILNYCRCFRRDFWITLYKFRDEKPTYDRFLVANSWQTVTWKAKKELWRIACVFGENPVTMESQHNWLSIVCNCGIWYWWCLPSGSAVTVHSETLCNIWLSELLSRWEAVSFTTHSQAGGQPLVGCSWLLIQYIRSYIPYLEVVPSNMRTCYSVGTRDYQGWATVGFSRLNSKELVN
jgi:hypothetical protein